jgi:hypothetical protein
VVNGVGPRAVGLVAVDVEAISERVYQWRSSGTDSRLTHLR